MYHFDPQILAYELTTLYLFTFDDFVTIVLTNTIYGTALPLAGGLLQPPAFAADLISRVPLVLLWVWINLLLFNLSNQSQPGAILEDATNKPWRPLPAGRLSSWKVHSYTTATSLATLVISLVFGGTYPSLCLQVLTFWYNDLGGGENWILRNVLNAGGYLCFLVGAMQVAVGVQKLHYSDKGWEWLCWTSTIVACTMHIQDLYDQEGDRLRHRRTIPLVFGDSVARYTIALPVVIWSLVAPTFWVSNVFGFLPSVALAAMRRLEFVDYLYSHASLMGLVV